MTNLVRRPLVPEDRRNGGDRPAMYLQRACLAHAVAAISCPRGERTTPHEAAVVAQQRWGDAVTEIVLRGASTPATTTAPDWAGVFAQQAVGDFAVSLEPLSAGARLLNTCPRITLDREATIKFPRRTGPTAPVSGWVAEQGPLPNVMFSLQSATLGPTHKCGCIAVTTRELVESSAIETVLNTLMREGTALALDTKLFSADAASPAACAGLLDGVAALTPTGGSDNDAMLGDLDKISAAIAPFTSGLVYVMHPTQASFLKRRRGWAVDADIVVWPTLGCQAGVVIGLDPAALASAYGPEPEVRASREGVLHEDTTPLAIATPGTPPVIAAPTRDLYQTDCVATLLILRAAWTWRAAGCIAWVENATWGAPAP
jgi:Phage capsid family